MVQTWIHMIITILFLIWHYKHVFLNWIQVFDTLVLQEKLLLPSFSVESKFMHQIGQTWILIISIHFMIGCCKHVLFIGIHGFDALVLYKMISFPPFSLEINVHPLNLPGLDSCNTLQSYGD